MLSFPSAVRIYLAVDPADMRKSFDGLYAVAVERLKENPLEGAMFVFSNRQRNRLKILYWEGTGLWSWPSDWKREASPGRAESPPQAASFG